MEARAAGTATTGAATEMRFDSQKETKHEVKSFFFFERGRRRGDDGDGCIFT